MEVYETIKTFASKTRKIAAIGLIATLPHICESCDYSGNKASAAEIKRAITQSQTPEKTLDVLVE